MARIVDCAVGVDVGDAARLAPHLPARWRSHLERFGSRAPAVVERPAHADLASVRAQLDEYDVAIGVVAPSSDATAQNNLELAAAMAAAVNDWQIATWLEPEPRLRGSIAVAHEDATLAVTEIERRAPDRRFVQVLLPGVANAPLGDLRYEPILAAAARHGLPICVAREMPANLTSLVFNGIFERHPGLRVLSIAGGCGWVAPLTWRLDGSWKVLKDEVPDLRRLPSEYIRDHCWFAVGADAPRVRQVVEHLGYDDRIVLGGDAPTPELSPKVVSENARALHVDRL